MRNSAHFEYCTSASRPPRPPLIATGYDEAAGPEKGVQRLHRVGARLAPLGKWPLEAAFLGWYPGQRTEHRQPLQRDDARTYSALLTSKEGHFRVMIERSTKRKTTAVPAPTTTPATTSARRTPTVTPRTVADATANATSAGAGRGPLIAQPLSLLVMYLLRSSHAMRAWK
jgi:hypothetical protein